MSIDNLEPYVRAIWDKAAVVGIRLRVGVSNVGVREARSVRAYVWKWWAKLDSPPDGWIEYDTDLLPIRWSSDPAWQPDIPSDFTTILPPGVEDFAEVIELSRYGPSTKLIFPDARSWPFRPESNYPMADHRVEVRITAEECRPLSAIFSFEVPSPGHVSKFQLSERPLGHIMRSGLYSLTSQNAWYVATRRQPSRVRRLLVTNVAALVLFGTWVLELWLPVGLVGAGILAGAITGFMRGKRRVKSE